jgi:predicted ATPase/class 3 adenylate cyclase
MSDLPTGTVTFLFTDLEGSTRLWQDHPEAMRGALARHDEILRDAVAAHDGHVVKTTGDGIHAVFASAHHALDAAVRAQHALGSERWTTPDPLKVRMGLHTGEAEHRNGDYYGTATNRAARLMSVAHGGQILVSLSTEELLSDDEREGITLVDLGEHRLRDLSRPDRVFQVRAPGLVVDFPPIRSLDAFPGNLPVQLSSFVGRRDELVALAAILRDARLVTITGTGGVGKTRLAVQLAAEILQRFPDGAWLCELAAASDADSMVLVVAATLGVEPRAGITLVESVVEFLRHKQALVIVDNCEHVLDSSARLADAILRGCQNVRVLATSREGLGAEGEQAWPLRSLPITADPENAAGLAEAPQLFIERARAAQPEIALHSSDSVAIEEICQRLDGIPLAIELAAARVVSMSPPQIASRLDERFRLLTGGRRTAVERHQTLRATVDWSYSMLEEREQTVFNRLGVFSGSFDAAAAESIAADDRIEEWDVVDALGGLVAKSLVIAERSQGTTRYQLLETMRAYAREQLDATDDADTWRRRHAQHYAEFAEACGPALRGPDEILWRRRLAEELDNLRAAVLWGLDATGDADAQLALRIVAYLAWESIFDRASGIGAWARRALPRAASTSGGIRASVVAAAAADLSWGGQHQSAQPLAIAAMEEWRSPECPTPSLPHVVLGVIEAYLGRTEEALRLGLESQRAFADADLWTRAGLCTICAAWASSVGEDELALAQAEDAVRQARDAGNPSQLVNALWSYGWMRSFDDDEVGRRALEESVELVRKGASSSTAGVALSRLAPLRARSGDRRGALAALRESVVLSAGVLDHIALGASICLAVVTFDTLGHHEAAAVLSGAWSSGVVVGNVSAREREEEARAATRARDELGAARAQELERRGASTSYDEIAEYILGAIDDLTAEDDDA